MRKISILVLIAAVGLAIMGCSTASGDSTTSSASTSSSSLERYKVTNKGGIDTSSGTYGFLFNSDGTLSQINTSTSVVNQTFNYVISGSTYTFSNCDNVVLFNGDYTATKTSTTLTLTITASTSSGNNLVLTKY
jgi:hypothetical protein